MEWPIFLVSVRDLRRPTAIQASVALSRGLNSAARRFNAPLEIQFTLFYFSGREPVRVSATVPIKSTTEGLPLNENTVVVDATFQNQADGTPVPPLDNASPVTCSLRLVFADAQGGPVEEALEPAVFHTIAP